MDEILIDEKKYVSSKQAAKITGYAKDYIGQLCREGRVPARLVGRSWYVLETAIQDHRFGSKDVESKEVQSAVSKPVFAQTWGAPRYEAATDNLLPVINRPEPDESEIKVSEEERLHDSWRAWFNHVPEEGVPTSDKEAPEQEVREEGPETDNHSQVIEDPGVSVPITTVYYDLPPKDLLPNHATIEKKQANNEVIVHSRFTEEQVQRNVTLSSKGGILKTLQVLGVFIAMIAASLAVVGSGYIDEYVVSISQASIISGVDIYNK